MEEKMKKLTKVAAAFAVALTLFSANAVAAKKEKPAKEKAAKTEKAKPVKAVKFDQAKFDEAYAAGDYATCASMLLGKNDNKNLVKDMIDADMLLYLSADYQNAGKGFLEAYGKMQQTTSELTGGKAIGAALGGENAIKYSGAEYERFLTWSMRLATALGNKQNDVASGIVKDYTGTFLQEILALRALNEEMEKASEESAQSDDFKNAEAALKKANVDLGISKMNEKKPAKSNEKYERSPFFGYLGTLAWAVNDDFDHAEQFASDQQVSKGLVGEVIKVPAGKGRLEVVALSGTIGKRSEKAVQDSISLPIGGTIYTKVVCPEFKKQNHAIDSVRVTLAGESSKTASPIEDFDTGVRIDVAQKAYGAYSRSVFRNVVKNSVSVAGIIAANAALEKAGSNPIAAKAAQIAVDKAIDAAAQAIVNSEKADVRQGVYFPHMASAAGFSVAPGTYAVTIEYLNGSSVVETKTIQNVVVEAGKVSVAVSSCEK